MSGETGGLTAVLVELRAIRALLERQAVCQHGATGVCMWCIQPTLDGIEMAVRQAVSR